MVYTLIFHRLTKKNLSKFCLQGLNHITTKSTVRFGGLKGNNASGTFSKKEPYTEDLKHNSYPMMNNQNTHLSKAEREHIMLFNPLHEGLSGSLTGNTCTNDPFKYDWYISYKNNP